MPSSVQYSHAVVDDLPGVTDLAAKFHSEAASNFMSFDRDVFARNWRTFIEAGLGTIFLAKEDGKPVSMLGAILVPDPVDGRSVATEMFWFTDPEARSRKVGLPLFSQFEEWAKTSGAERAMMVHLLNSMPEKLAHFYTRRGYAPVETHYLKQLSK